MTNALLLVDLQKDFAPGGALPVPHAHDILPSIQQLVQLPFHCIVASKDWHPEGHCSFAAVHEKEVGEEVEVNGLTQKLWPVHCVQGSLGAELLSGWDHTAVDKVLEKGTDPSIDSYSAFYDNARLHATGLEDYLKEKGVTQLIIAGLATDVCVHATALDAISLGFTTYVVKEACKGLDRSEQALQEIETAGGKVCNLPAVAALLGTPTVE